MEHCICGEEAVMCVGGIWYCFECYYGQDFESRMKDCLKLNDEKW